MKGIFVELEPGNSVRLDRIIRFARHPELNKQTNIYVEHSGKVDWTLVATPYEELKKRIEEANGQG